MGRGWTFAVCWQPLLIVVETVLAAFDLSVF